MAITGSPIGLGAGLNWVDPLGLKGGPGFYPTVIGLDPSAHPVFQHGTYENQLIVNDIKRILNSFDSPDVTSAISRFHEYLKSNRNDNACQGNDKNPNEFSPSEIAEMNKRARMLAAKMRYQQLKHEMENWHLR